MSKEKTTKSKTKNKKVSFNIYKIQKNSYPWRSWFFFFLVIVIISFGLIYSLLSHRATIYIRPHLTPSIITQNFIIALSDSEIPQEEKHLPIIKGVMISEKFDFIENFPTSGKSYKVSNASGKVVLFNETNEDKFIVPSRLKTSGGLIFRTQDNIVIPARTIEKAGTITALVVADEFKKDKKPIGRLGNIIAGTRLYFPALRKPLRQLYYAKAILGPLTGGSTLVNKFITQDDLDSITEKITEIVFHKSREKIRQKTENMSLREDEDFILIDDEGTFILDIYDVKFDEKIKIGDFIESFQVNGKVENSGLVFRLSDIINFSSKKILDTQDYHKKLLYLDKETFRYNVIDASKFSEQKWIKISVSLTGIQSLDIDSDNFFTKQWRKGLNKKITNKDKKSAKNILANQSEINEVVEIDISPWFYKKLPILPQYIDWKIVSD